MFTGIIGWIVVGVVAGYSAGTLVNRRGEGLLTDIVLGIVGAVIGGWLFNAFGAAGATGFHVWSLVVAVVGAVAVLWVWHAARRSAWHA